MEFIEHGSGSAIRFPIEDAAFAKARDALTAEWGKPAVFIGGGGSIPVTAELKKALGMDVMLAGFALEDDRIHSPNEKYDLTFLPQGHAVLGAHPARAGAAEAAAMTVDRRHAPKTRCRSCSMRWSAWATACRIR